MDTLIIGIKGTVLALDRKTGAETWRTPLKGGGFVNVALAEGQVLATTRGEMFCLNAHNGQVVWHNPLKGLGQGLVTIAADQGSGTMAACAQLAQEEEAATCAAIGAG